MRPVREVRWPGRTAADESVLDDPGACAAGPTRPAVETSCVQSPCLPGTVENQPTKNLPVTASTATSGSKAQQPVSYRVSGPLPTWTTFMPGATSPCAAATTPPGPAAAPMPAADTPEGAFVMAAGADHDEPSVDDEATTWP